MNQPAQLTGRRRAGILDAMQQGLSQPAPPRISIKAQKFTLVDSAGVQVPVQMFDPTYGLYLDVVIIGVNPNKSKIYYEFDYDPTKDEAPTCFSDNGVAPSAQAGTPQSPTCAMCPNNVWGSDTSKMTGKATKACSDRKKLAVIVVNDPSQLVYQLQIPPASLKNLATLAHALKSHQVTDADGARAADPADVVTRVYFNPQKQGELLFQPMGFHQQLAPYITPLIDHADQSGVIETITGANDVPYAGAIALANPQVAPQAALPAPAMQTQAPPPPPAQQFQQPAPQSAQAPQAGTQWGPSATPQQPGFAQPPLQQPPMNGQQAPAPAAPAPRTRRGGARQGAGRPAAGAAPQQAPQPQGAPFQPMAAPQAAPFGAPTAAVPVAQPVNTPQPAPFQMHAAPPAGPGAFPDAPAFLQVAQPAAAPAPAPFAPQPAPAFGMMNAPAPDPALGAALASAFGAPMQPRQR